MLQPVSKKARFFFGPERNFLNQNLLNSSIVPEQTKRPILLIYGQYLYFVLPGKRKCIVLWFAQSDSKTNSFADYRHLKVFWG